MIACLNSIINKLFVQVYLLSKQFQSQFVAGLRLLNKSSLAHRESQKVLYHFLILIVTWRSSTLDKASNQGSLSI